MVGATKLARFRTQRHLSFSALGELLGVHTSMACFLCQGKRRPSLSLALKIEQLTCDLDVGAVRPADWEGSLAA